ncbi:hypothetical protein KJ973_01480 [Patescibacteria group bacterium]|nr:hypothetical protein [Patescibacteria group bacterium]MBU1519348.1 hypothetical protein [Patescibacteria group bacterium]MBU1730090.1 hypothetical protein [Patescibacteria group bacterium]MBU1956065.1 hypothetical protein [Patescibacteria group bacterium]MBU2010161.1 hypothetical protein [Patescibacteria group bacterium]
MKPSSESSIQPITEFEHFLNRLSENDLRLLNRMVVERLKLYHKVSDLKNLAKFNLMDKVSFQHNNQYISGVVLKLNRRSVTIRATDGHRWNVAPSFLTRLR